jgi:hypothetical protein
VNAAVIPLDWRKQIKDQLNEKYDLLGLLARLRHATTGSAVFDLGVEGNTLDTPGSDGDRSASHFPNATVFVQKGWLDIHYPCEGLHRLVIRCSLNDVTDDFATMNSIVEVVAQWLSIDHDTINYHIHLTTGGQTYLMESP